MTFPRTGDKKLTKKQSTKKVTKKNKKKWSQRETGVCERIQQFNATTRLGLFHIVSREEKKKNFSFFFLFLLRFHGNLAIVIQKKLIEL